VATGHGVSWADTTGGTGGSADHSGPATTRGVPAGPGSLSGTGAASGPTSSGAGAAAHGTDPDLSPLLSSSGGATAKTTNADSPATKTPAISPSGAESSATAGAGSWGASTSTSTPTAPLIPTAAAHKGARVVVEPGSAPTAETGSSAHTASPAPVVTNSELARPSSSVNTDTAPATTPPAAHAAPVTTTVAAAATVSTAAVSTPASAPAAVSPMASIMTLAAHIAETVLGFFGIQTASGTTPTPISPAPLAQLLFAVFREIEGIAGLDSPPTVQPALISETFTGSLTTVTPTVAEFLDAATAEYVLGGQPSGLRPFTVNGVPVTYTNDLTGTSAQVWVTPQKQIIIAYSGTTGGTNLLFDQLIAVTQVLGDTQYALTLTAPAALPDALRFAQQVQAEAAQQGYAPNSIFVTGHSLGGLEAEYVAENTGLGGIGFESLGLTTTVPGNGADSLFVNTATYGDPVGFFASDLPGEQPFAPSYVAGGGSVPHYGPIVLLGDSSSQYPLTNAAPLWGTGIVGDLAFAFFGLGQLFEYHLPGVQAYSLDVNPEPDILPGVGVDTGPVYTGFGDLTIPEFLRAASADGILIEP
jgi:hypothetical protein